MNTSALKRTFIANKFVASILNKLTQRADFYPIKYYHRKKRNRSSLQSL